MSICLFVGLVDVCVSVCLSGVCACVCVHACVCVCMTTAMVHSQYYIITLLLGVYVLNREVIVSFKESFKRCPLQ